MYNFGSGTLWATRTDVGANPTPRKFGTLQECSVDFSATNKELFGAYTFPVAVGRGTAKIAGKAKFGSIQGSVLSDIYFGVTPTTGASLGLVEGEAGTIPTTPYQVTVANSANWTTDLGVVYATSGLPLKRVASGPITGQYSVAAGVYTFAAADTTLGVQISYRYSISTSGQNFTIANSLIGTAPIFSIVLKSLFSTQQSVLTLNQCVSSKLNIQTKLEDFVIPEFDFSAFADASNNVGTYSFSDLA